MRTVYCGSLPDSLAPRLFFRRVNSSSAVRHEAAVLFHVGCSLFVKHNPPRLACPNTGGRAENDRIVAKRECLDAPFRFIRGIMGVGASGVSCRVAPDTGCDHGCTGCFSACRRGRPANRGSLAVLSIFVP